jgi:glycosyltransferase involved in cell wall biosynthesis
MLNRGCFLIKILHITTGLMADGAETMLRSLIGQMDRSRFSNEVLSLTTLGDLGSQMQADGIDVRAINLTKNPLKLLPLYRMAKLIRRSKPDVIQTWMYHADLIGGLLGRMGGRVPIVWGIHHAGLDASTNKMGTLATAKVCAYLSRSIPSRIVCCSLSAQRSHTSFGYARPKTEFIPNGFDIGRFRPNAEARMSVRKELHISSEIVVIAMAARFHPHKDHETFLRAAAILAEQTPDVQFVLCGAGITWDNRQLTKHIDGSKLHGRVHFLGIRMDVDRVFAAADIATSSSRTEACPLAVGEAMATATPCVVTDVGDSAHLVGDTGTAVPPEDPVALAKAWLKLCGEGQVIRRRMGQAARIRIEQNFSLAAIARQYEDLYARVAVS